MQSLGCARFQRRNMPQPVKSEDLTIDLCTFFNGPLSKGYEEASNIHLKECRNFTCPLDASSQQGLVRTGKEACQARLNHGLNRLKKTKQDVVLSKYHGIVHVSLESKRLARAQYLACKMAMSNVFFCLFYKINK